MNFTKIDQTLKMSETDTHVFFLNGPFSQWYPSVFSAQLDLDSEVFTFNCAEQYMMAAKAYIFEDYNSLEEIMTVEQGKDWREAPKRQKELGRKVQGFDDFVWDEHAREVVYHGNLAKFSQNPELFDFLLSTGTKTLVEGAHYDRIWGVGLRWDDPSIIEPANWKGTNWLGEALMRVRNGLGAFQMEAA